MAWEWAEAEASDRTSGRGQDSGSGLPYGLPATLPNLAAEEEVPAKLTDPAPSASKRDKKHSHADDDDDITELPVGDEPVLPLKKKKKKNKDKSKEEIPVPDVPDDGARLSSSSAKPEEAMGPMLATDLPGIPDEETEKPKKKKKKKKKKHKEDPGLKKFREQEREAKAKEIARNLHRELKRKLDFQSVRRYRKKIPPELLDTINGADHSVFLTDKLKEDDNYMSQKNDYRRNLMSTERLLARIAKYADNLDQRLKEAQSILKTSFPKVQGIVTVEKAFPKLVVWVLLDCFDQPIDCNHREYGKEQNMGLHDVFHPAAMARVTPKETHVVDSIPTEIKVDAAFCPLCNYYASYHRVLNNHVQMHLRTILMCGWPGCYFVHMQAVHMIEHSAKVHNMAWAKPSRGDKGGN